MMEKPTELETEKALLKIFHLKTVPFSDDYLKGIDGIDKNGFTYQIRHRINGPDAAFKLSGPGSCPWHETTADFWVHVGADGMVYVFSVNEMKAFSTAFEKSMTKRYHAGNQAIGYISPPAMKKYGRLAGRICGGKNYISE